MEEEEGRWRSGEREQIWIPSSQDQKRPFFAVVGITLRVVHPILAHKSSSLVRRRPSVLRFCSLELLGDVQACEWSREGAGGSQP